MAESFRLLSLVVRGLALGLVAAASLGLALFVATHLFARQGGQVSTGTPAYGVALLLGVGAGLWLYARGPWIAERVAGAVRRRGDGLPPAT